MYQIEWESLKELDATNPTDGEKKQQYDIRRYLKGFKLWENTKQHLSKKLKKDIHDKIHKKVKRSLNNIQETIKNIDPSMADFITDKYNKK